VLAVDAETRAYFDAFRLELRRDLAEAVASMRRESRGDLAEVRTELSRAIAAAQEASHADLTEAIAAVRGDLAQAIAAAREAGRADLAEAMTTLRAEIRTGATETRRHFDVVAEGLRGDMRLVAEGVVSNTEAIERLRSDVAREMDERFHVVHLAFADTRREIGELRALIR
jgi:hypothetical protein